MKKLQFILLSICFLFTISCSYSILNPNTGNLGNNNINKSKTMYFKFKVSGKSYKMAFNKNNIFPRELSIKNYGNNSTFTHTGNWGDQGYVVNYLFCDDKMGNSMSIPFYAGDSKLQTSYSDKDSEITKPYITRDDVPDSYTKAQTDEMFAEKSELGAYVTHSDLSAYDTCLRTSL